MSEPVIMTNPARCRQLPLPSEEETAILLLFPLAQVWLRKFGLWIQTETIPCKLPIFRMAPANLPGLRMANGCCLKPRVRSEDSRHGESHKFI